MLGRDVDASSKRGFFKNVKDIFKNSDITFANLESPLCEKLEFIKNKKYVFSAKEDSA